IAVVNNTSVPGKNLCHTVCKVMTDLGIDIKKCIGSSTDGASNMRGRAYKYKAPSPPTELIDCSYYTNDFENRKFLHVGIDPVQQFIVSIQIITSSRHVNISVDFLKRIYSLMGHILSYILTTSVKYKRFIFLESELISLSSIVYRGDIMVVVESKTQEGCRIILNLNDLMTLQNLEWTIFEIITTKMTVIRPMILQQVKQLTEYFKTDFNLDKSVTLEEVVVKVKGIHNELISKHVPKNKLSFINQIKLLAIEQLAKIDENDGPKNFFSPPFSQSFMPQTSKQPNKTVILNNNYKKK
ncbi:Uncharacterized protein FWK35_00029573, partial [Aphis craccivora]